MRLIKKGPQQGRSARYSICGLDNDVNRIFNRNSWDCGGRFYGGWWQGIGSELRKKIYINGQPTIEVDYQALHIGILNARHGVTVEGDPYALDGLLLPNLDQRKIVKLLVLMSINAKDRNTACMAFRQASPAGSIAKSMKNVELLRILDAFIAKHPHLEGDLCSDRGVYLMRQDSDIASLVINHMTAKGIPVLCIHDSFIVDYSHGKALKSCMAEASRSILGCSIPVSNNYLGLDEVRETNPDLEGDYIRFRHIDCCPEYQTRQRLHAERVAYLS